MKQDLAEIMKMVLIIAFWAGLYCSGKYAVWIYVNDVDETQDFIPSVEDSIKSIYAHINGNCGKHCG